MARTFTLQTLKGLVAEKINLEHQSYILRYSMPHWSDTVLLCLFSILGSAFFLGLYIVVIQYLFVDEFYVFFTTLVFSIFFSSFFYYCTKHYFDKQKYIKNKILIQNIQTRVLVINEQLSGQDKIIYDVGAFFLHMQDLDDCIEHVYHTNQYSSQIYYIEMLKEKAAQHFRNKNHIQYLLVLNQIDNTVRKIDPVFTNPVQRNKQQAKQRLMIVR